ncbi:cell wall-active antibiotics response protein LiaF [Caldalkalibacillus mannanilyticus]|uniref:cell wall-active antibiotics response protein LiaF n=1 Tax=Caldalkalibacillus mannanilyticus TaxID=1418 RepID=UPI00046A60FA|nr:cell wall-active antibiotics response protein LiaF [Caldalkalibacillus mannanilyticus]
MLNRFKTEDFNGLVLLGIVLLLIELSFFNGQPIVFLIFSFFSITYGYRRMTKTRGKILFWFGIVIVAITILNMVTFKIFLIIFLIYLLKQFRKSKQHPSFIEPEVMQSEKIRNEPIVRREPLFTNKLLGVQRTPDHVYEWNDISIQGGIGDTIIDLSYTVLPKGESVISIRHMIGRIQILVPYEVEVSVHHSTIFGKTTVLQYEDNQYFNQTFHIQTPEYDQAEQKIKIMTSILSGDLEVKRI